MTFVSYAFVVFLLAVLALNAALRGRPRSWMLLAASYVFYGWWDWRFLGLIVLSSWVDFAVGRRVDREVHPELDDRARRRWLMLSLASNLGLLGVFKYLGFFVESARTALESLGLEPSLPTLSIILPVGISFYTFQTLSYTIDVYRGTLRSTRRIDDFFLYVAFFPQLVAGPIERASHLLPQIERMPRPTPRGFASGFELLLVGFVFKMVVADNMAPYVNAVFHQADPGGASVATATVAFALQIYGDFAGYSLIARGSARMLGFDIMENFRMPYVSRSPSEFWQRWHISLSSWLRDYLYVPLGGNRGGTATTYRNLVVTMLLGGLWHGAAWTFIIWGAWHGLLLVVYRAFGDRSKQTGPGATGLPLGRRLWTGAVFFALTCVGWLIFRAESFDQLAAYATSLATDWRGEGVDWPSYLRVLAFALPMVAVDAWCLATRNMEPWTRWPAPVRVLLALVGFYLVVLLGSPYSAEFIYFQF